VVALAFVVPAPSEAAASNTAKVSPTQAKPGEKFIFSGRSPDCGGQPYEITQTYTDNEIRRIRTQPPLTGFAGTDGSFSAMLTVPPGAARSNVLRPYGGWQYDAAQISFPGCESGIVAANVLVLPVSSNQHIALSTRSPRTKSTLDVTVTNCVGGVIKQFAWVVDGQGSYFNFSGTFSGTTYTGSADLSSGLHGAAVHTGPARVSSPLGLEDSMATIGCAQSVGPDSVARADHLMHLSSNVPITIAPESGPIVAPYAPRPEPTVGPAGHSINASSAGVGESVPGAPPASAVAGEPSFVG
jgi:hypothetical protein